MLYNLPSIYLKLGRPGVVEQELESAYKASSVRSVLIELAGARQVCNFKFDPLAIEFNFFKAPDIPGHF